MGLSKRNDVFQTGRMDFQPGVQGTHLALKCGEASHIFMQLGVIMQNIPDYGEGLFRRAICFAQNIWI